MVPAKSPSSAVPRVRGLVVLLLLVALGGVLPIHTHAPSVGGVRQAVADGQHADDDGACPVCHLTHGLGWTAPAADLDTEAAAVAVAPAFLVDVFVAAPPVHYFGRAPPA